MFRVIKEIWLVMHLHSLLFLRVPKPKIHLSRKIQYIELFSMYVCVALQYAEFSMIEFDVGDVCCSLLVWHENQKLKIEKKGCDNTLNKLSHFAKKY